MRDEYKDILVEIIFGLVIAALSLIGIYWFGKGYDYLEESIGENWMFVLVVVIIGVPSLFLVYKGRN